MANVPCRAGNARRRARATRRAATVRAGNCFRTVSGLAAGPVDDYFELKSSKASALLVLGPWVAEVTLGDESRDEILGLIAQIRQGLGASRGPKTEKERSDGASESVSGSDEETGATQRQGLRKSHATQEPSNRQKRKEQLRLGHKNKLLAACEMVRSNEA